MSSVTTDAADHLVGELGDVVGSEGSGVLGDSFDIDSGGCLGIPLHDDLCSCPMRSRYGKECPARQRLVSRICPEF